MTDITDFEKYKQEELSKFLMEVRTVAYQGEIATGPGGELSLATARNMLESAKVSKVAASTELNDSLKLPPRPQQGKVAGLLQRFGLMQKKPTQAASESPQLRGPKGPK